MTNNSFKKEDKFTNKFNSQSQNLSFKDPHKKIFKYDPTNNSFNKSNSHQKFNKDNSIKETPIELNNTNLFPDLVPIKQNAQTIIECNKFKHILTNTPINNESFKTHIIPHGCIEITRVLQQYVYEYGTTSFIQKEKKEEEDLNYITNNTIDTMKTKWETYENAYDNIHGEGVYANNFRLPPLRDDFDSEEQNNSDEYNSDEYSDS
jgi:hypothetical protein